MGSFFNELVDLSSNVKSILRSVKEKRKRKSGAAVAPSTNGKVSGLIPWLLRCPRVKVASGKTELQTASDVFIGV